MSRCPEAAYGYHSDPDVSGRCIWCRSRLAPPAPKPWHLPPSRLSAAYDYHYNPDWGGRPDREELVWP